MADGNDPDYGRRSTKNPNRKQRLIAGTGSLPIGILVCYMLNKNGLLPPEPEMQWAINSIIGSGITVLTLCFNDIRSMVLERFGRRRATDRKRK